MKKVDGLWRLVEDKFRVPAHYLMIEQKTRKKKRVFIETEKDFNNIIANQKILFAKHHKGGIIR